MTREEEALYQHFVFPKPLHGHEVIASLKTCMKASWYQDKKIYVQVVGQTWELHQPTSIPLRLESPAGTTDLINPCEIYYSIYISKDHVRLFTKLPNAW